MDCYTWSGPHGVFLQYRGAYSEHLTRCASVDFFSRTPRTVRLTPRASIHLCFAKHSLYWLRDCMRSHVYQRNIIRPELIRFLNQTGGRMVRQNGVDVDIAVDRLQKIRNKDSGWFAIAQLLLECNQTMARYLEEIGNE